MNTTVAIDICSNALMLLGHKPIASFDEEGTGAQVSKAFYESSYRAKLGGYTWNFAKQKVLLTKMNEEPLNQWKYMYQLPTDHIRTITVFPHSDYTIVKDKVYSDTDNLEMDFIYRVDESFMTALFREAFEIYLAGKFAVSVTENVTAADAWMKQSDRAFKSAKTVDAQEKPNRGSVEAAAIPYRLRGGGHGRGRY